MPRFILVWVILGLLTGHAAASPSGREALSPGAQCRAAIVAAERTHGLPAQLLAAIGRVESGRRDPATGTGGAWPWTINAEGQGAYFDSKAQAIAAVEGLRARGVRSIDVGCMQVNLMHHAAAFPNLDQAFEPALNADYAARFLLRLREQTGDWTKATAHYHSATPERGEPYAAKVMAVWPDEQRKAGMSPAPSPPVAMAVSSAFPAFQTLQPARMIPLPAMAGTQPVPLQAMPGAAPGRGLDAYRAAPIRMAASTPLLMMRMPPRITR